MELKLEDLYVECDTCKGEGRITEGAGTKMTWTGPCDKCNGIGGNLTDIGKVLNQFIRLLKAKGL